MPERLEIARVAALEVVEASRLAALSVVEKAQVMALAVIEDARIAALIVIEEARLAVVKEVTRGAVQEILKSEPARTLISEVATRASDNALRERLGDFHDRKS
jgi:hypothetical protein